MDMEVGCPGAVGEGLLVVGANRLVGVAWTLISGSSYFT